MQCLPCRYCLTIRHNLKLHNKSRHELSIATTKNYESYEMPFFHRTEQYSKYWRTPRGVSLPVSAHARTLHPPLPNPTRLPNFVPFPTFVFNSLLRKLLLIRNRPRAHVFGLVRARSDWAEHFFSGLTLYPF